MTSQLRLRELPLYSLRDTPICDWAEREVVLPASTPHPGRLRLTAWQRGILEEWGA